MVTCNQHYSSAETCLSAFQAPLDPSTALGGFSGNNFSEVTSEIIVITRPLFLTKWCFFPFLQASAFIITYPVNNEVDRTGNENGKAVAWEKAFVHLVKVTSFILPFSLMVPLCLFLLLVWTCFLQLMTRNCSMVVIPLSSTRGVWAPNLVCIRQEVWAPKLACMRQEIWVPYLACIRLGLFSKNKLKKKIFWNEGKECSLLKFPIFLA